MMLFSDIHDHCLFPYRTTQVVKESKQKFPFNKPLGIDTTEEGVNNFLNNLISHIEEYYLLEVIENLEKPSKSDPIIELARLQFYEETSQMYQSTKLDDILPNEIFYSLQQLRKHIHDDISNEMRITEDEKANKIHNTFIHDKMLFDSFNTALNSPLDNKQELSPWITGSHPIKQKRYTNLNAMVILNKAKDLVLEWNKMTSPDLNNIDPLPKPEILNPNQDPIPSQEERNNQLREEKLSNLLSQEINQEDKAWLNYND
jgi:hypothetical protein